MVSRYFYMLIIAGFILSFYIWQQNQSTRLGYRVDNLRHECERWQQEHKSWETKVIFLPSMERLDKVAKEKKLVSPNEKNIVYLQS